MSLFEAVMRGCLLIEAQSLEGVEAPERTLDVAHRASGEMCFERGDERGALEHPELDVIAGNTLVVDEVEGLLEAADLFEAVLDLWMPPRDQADH